MKLEELAAEIRPRMGWEAIDLGCALVRRWLWPVWLGWLATAGVMCAVIGALLWRWPLLAALAVYWCKPVFERVTLHQLGHGLFGEEPTVRSALRAWPRLLFNRFFTYWVAIRFFTWTNRSVYMPILQLEGVRGGRYFARAGVIGRHAGNHTLALVAACYWIEFCLVLGVMLLMWIMIPEGLAPDFAVQAEEFFDIGFAALGPSFWLTLGRMFFVAYCVAIGIVQLVWVGGGFGLYLNSRSHQEGWDIELTFRRLGNRLRAGAGPGAGIAAALLLALFALPGTAPAQDGPTLDDFLEQSYDGGRDAGAPEDAIETVMTDEAFDVRTRIVNKPRVRSVPPSLMPGWFSILGYVLFWGTVLLVLGLIVWLVVRNRHLLRRGARAEAAAKQGPRSVLGMDISPESLPDDIVRSALALWEEGRAQAAISLLYRGAISHLVRFDQVPILESDTENDCLRRAAAIDDRDRVGYFADLTRTWIGLAYGRIHPSDEGVRDLCRAWPFNRAPAS